jgi:hypothetical protein
MSTIQLAVNDPAYARWVRSLLLRDSAHRQVYITDWPKLKLDGVIVEETGQAVACPQRSTAVACYCSERQRISISALDRRRSARCF